MKHPTDSRRAVIYARYSSHNQRDVSIDQQVKACRKFAERQDIEIVRIYDDRATTGTNDRRPGFQQMIKDAAKGNWDYVIVYTLDRFSRNRYDSAVNKRTLKTYGIKVLSAMENISDDPTGVLMESMLEGLAEYYSAELSRKIKRGMDDNASKCLCTGHFPYGYVRGADDRYAIDEAEAEVVREIFQKVRDGVRICDIIHDLNSRCLLTKRKKPWTSSSFNRLLSNERYTGVYIYDEIRIPGGMPQIIDKDLFDQVQLILHTKPNARKNTAINDAPLRRRQENGIYYLTGKLFCGHCHSPMIGISGHSKNGPLYYYYTCKGKRTDHTCDKKNVNREFIEKFIATALKETMLTDRAIQILADAAVAYQEKKAPTAELESLKSRLADTKKSIKNIIAAIEAGIFSTSTQSRLAELESEEKQLTTQLAILAEEAADKLTREEIIATLELFKSGDIHDQAFREAMIDTFLVAAYVYDDHCKIVFNLGGTKKSSTLPFNIEDVTFSDTSIISPTLHQSTLYEHFGLTVIMIGDHFVFSKRFKDIH